MFGMLVILFLFFAVPQSVAQIDGIYLWAACAAALRICARMLPNSSRFLFARM